MKRNIFCIKSACQWILCCYDFLCTLSLTIDRFYLVTVPFTPCAGITIIKKINFLSFGLLTLSQWYKPTANVKEVVKLSALPSFIIKVAYFFCLFLMNIYYQIFQVKIFMWCHFLKSLEYEFQRWRQFGISK